MPFTKNGLQPDLIMNPNAMPSRMTFGQFIESIGGKVAALSGKEVDGTPFNDIDIESLKDELEKYGYNREGTEIMYNGMTGKQMKVEIFIGPLSYQRLKHQVADKIHARARGPYTLLTRQPPEGRARDGGLRFGKTLPKWEIKLLLVHVQWAIYPNCGNILKLLILNYYGNMIMVLGKTQEYSYNLEDWLSRCYASRQPRVLCTLWTIRSQDSNPLIDKGMSKVQRLDGYRLKRTDHLL